MTSALFRLLPLGAIGLAAGLLSGCAAHPNASHAHGSMMTHDHHGAMDMQAMCERHRQMMGSMSPAEHQAMMQEHMKGMPMSAEHMQKHMQEMQERCKRG